MKVMREKKKEKDIFFVKCCNESISGFHSGTLAPFNKSQKVEVNITTSQAEKSCFDQTSFQKLIKLKLREIK